MKTGFRIREAAAAQATGLLLLTGLYLIKTVCFHMNSARIPGE
jgi:hypothetical protein